MAETSGLEVAWAKLAPSVDDLARASGALKRIASQLSRPEGYESLKKVERALDLIDGLDGLPAELLDGSRRAAAPVRAWLDGEWTRRATLFEAELRAYFEERLVPISGGGRVIHAPPVTMRVDGARDRVDLTYAGEDLKGGLPLVPDRVFREREAALQRLRRASTPPDELAEQLLAAYDALGGQSSARIRLTKLHFQLFVDRQTVQSRAALTRSKIKEYPRAQFAWDLAGLLAAPHFLRRGARAIELVAATASASDSRSASVRVVAMDGTTESYAAMRVS